MKYSEKLQLLLKGVKMEEIKDLEAQEKEELEADSGSKELDKSEEIQDNKADGEALEAAKSMIEELETKLGNAQDELTRLNSEIAAINNRATQDEDLPRYDATAVFSELFNKNKTEV